MKNGSTTPQPEAAHGTLTSYTIGFVLSIVFTLAAYFAVVDHLLVGGVLAGAIAALGVVQLIVQLVFFLHLASESKPRWNLVVFLFMLVVLVILVFGSLWIMYNLNYNMASPHDVDTQIIQDEGISK